MVWRDAEGSMVAGGNDDDSELNQLHSPYGLTFDSEGNLYVADHGSDRIIKYKKFLNEYLMTKWQENFFLISEI